MTVPVERRETPRKSKGSGSSMFWKAAIGIAVSAALLYFAFRKVEFAAVANEMWQADPLMLALATVGATAVFWIRAWRWRAILEPVAQTSFRSRFAAVNIGFMGNNLLPARAGEFARAYSLSRFENVPIVASFSSLMLERLFDAVFIIALMFVAMSLPDFPGWPLAADINFPAIARWMAGAVALAIAILLGLVLWPRRAAAAMEAIAMRVLPRPLRRPVVDALEAFVAGASSLRDPRLLFRTAAWSLVLWLVNAVGFWLAFFAFDIHLPFTAALFFQSCIALGVSVPSAPGFFGAYEYVAKLVLADLWGTEASKALGMALGYHIAGLIPVTLMGLYYAWRLGISLRGVARSEEVVEQAVEDQTGIDPDNPER